jgi:hypothetical protein
VSPTSPDSAAKPPAWFGPAVDAVLGQADITLTAGDAWELERVTAELLGAELHHVVSQGYTDLQFDRWFDEVVTAAARQVRGGPQRGRAPWRLLGGLSSICPAPTLPSVLAAAGWAGGPALPDAGWVATAHRVRATGDVWWLRDVYGTRFGVIASFVRADGPRPMYFLFDIDASCSVLLVGCDLFGGLGEAASAWRSLVGDSAEGVRPRTVSTADDLVCLVQCELGTRAPEGIESRATLRDWYRATRRFQDLADTVLGLGMPLPPPQFLHDVDPGPMAAEFVGWWFERHGVLLDLTVVSALAEEWMEGVLPSTWHSVSPDRVEFKRQLIDDWIPDDPTTVAVKALLPDWVRWHGEVTGLPDHLIGRALAIVTPV